jgi:transposase InsO family protein
MLECLLNLPEVTVDKPFVLNFAQIAEKQKQDVELMALITSEPRRFKWMAMSDSTSVIVDAKDDHDYRICIPEDLLDPIVAWYHQTLVHLGASRLYDTINTHLTNSSLRAQCEAITQTCDACQRYKTPGRGYGKMPPREALLCPWREIACDLIGPWTIEVMGQKLRFRALTIIDTVTNWPEIILIYSKHSSHVGLQLENAWLSRYPRPSRIIYDQGTEFTGWAFQRLINRHGIHGVPTTVKNPQANAICERMHQSITNSLRALLHTNPPQNVESAHLLMDTALQTAAYATRVATHGTLKISPGAMIFQRDMILDIPIVADLELLRQRRQAAIDTNLIRANRRRISHDYQVGDLVLILAYKPDKLQPRVAAGPFPITIVHSNGTVTIQRSPLVSDRINIRRIRPYRQ